MNPTAKLHQTGPPVDEALREYCSLATSINATFANKIRRGIFNPIAPNVSGYIDAEDRLQDAIAQTWQIYKRNAEAGRTLEVAEATCSDYCHTYWRERKLGADLAEYAGLAVPTKKKRATTAAEVA